MNAREKKTAGTPRGLRIMNQFRSKSGFVYDLKSDTDRLTIGIAPVDEADATSDWVAEARCGSRDEGTSVVGRGATRGDAVREIARAWQPRAVAHELPVIDWEAVAAALADVRAV